ncbi:MAG TPA: ATP-binding protein [Trichocoleus sp.]|jgi:signal transduction histidine kinase
MEKSISSEVSQAEHPFTVQQLLAHLPGVIYQLCYRSQELSFQYVSEGCQDLFHISPEALQQDGTLLLNQIHPEDRECFTHLLHRSAQTAQVWQWQGRVLLQDSVKWIQTIVRPQQQENGDVLWYGLIIEITEQQAALHERQQAEEAVRQAEARSRALLNAIPDLMLRLHRDGTYLDCQAPKDFHLVVFPNDRIGKNIREVLPPEVAEQRMRSIEQVLATGEMYTYEQQLTINGALHYEEARIAIAAEDEVLLIVRDITDRKEAEEALKQSEAQLRQQTQELQAALNQLQRTQIQLVQSEKMSSLGQLVAGVAHEINNPVNFIYGNLSHASQYTQDLLNLLKLYQKHYPHPVTEIQAAAEAIDLEFLVEDLPKLIASIRVGAERIQKIVASLRNFSRMDEAEMKAVDIHEGIDSTLLILQNRIKAKPDHHEICVLKEYGNLPLVECFAGQLNQVFMNILSNAIDALEDQEQNSSQAQMIAAPPQIRIITEQQNDHILIRFIDTGSGISKSKLNRIFDPFFTTKPIGKGTGLGMSISYQIIQKHGGSLRCFSEPNQGTEFLIEIPIWQSSDSILKEGNDQAEQVGETASTR